jgi:FkbM family methyltransferase
MFSSLVGLTGRVTAIEAEPDNAARLLHNVGLNHRENVDVHSIGVSDSHVVLPMFLNTRHNAGAHTFLVQNPHQQEDVEILSCVPLFGLLREERPAFMKLDIEGFECRVLKRYFEDAPKQLWPAFVMIEDEPQHREGDPVALLQSKGYKVLRSLNSNVLMKSEHVRTEVTM